MKITYIHHSTFCVEVDDKVFVFDYYDGTSIPSYVYHGSMPQFSRETPVYVFSSHSHRDHFGVDVLKWSSQYPNIQYIFAKEIKKKLGNSVIKKLGLEESIKEKIHYVKPMEQLELEGVQIETLVSTDSGVAFLVTYQGKTIYHAGDLNWWHWEGEPEEFNQYQEMTYKEQIDRLAERKLDAAFVVVDPRQGKDKYLGIDYFMQKCNAAYVIPMHLWKHYELIPEYKAYLRQKEGFQEKAERILEMTQENQKIL